MKDVEQEFEQPDEVLEKSQEVVEDAQVIGHNNLM